MNDEFQDLWNRLDSRIWTVCDHNNSVSESRGQALRCRGIRLRVRWGATFLQRQLLELLFWWSCSRGMDSGWRSVLVQGSTGGGQKHNLPADKEPRYLPERTWTKPVPIYHVCENSIKVRRPVEGSGKFLVWTRQRPMAKRLAIPEVQSYGQAIWDRAITTEIIKTASNNPDGAHTVTPRRWASSYPEIRHTSFYRLLYKNATFLFTLAIDNFLWPDIELLQK